MSCGVGRRCRLDPTLLWLWWRPAATAPIRPLAWEPPYAAKSSLRKGKKTKKKKKKKVTQLLRNRGEFPSYITWKAVFLVPILSVSWVTEHLLQARHCLGYRDMCDQRDVTSPKCDVYGEQSRTEFMPNLGTGRKS